MSNPANRRSQSSLLFLAYSCAKAELGRAEAMLLAKGPNAWLERNLTCAWECARIHAYHWNNRL